MTPPPDLSISVVTSSWGDYGKYLPDWARSLTAQTLRPKHTVIVDAGVKDQAALEQAREHLDLHDIPCTVVKTKYSGMGAARNLAVKHTQTEWVIHLDADDTLLPHALSDVAAVADSADVVSLGAIKNGTEYVYPDITAEKLLNKNHGIFSCGAFRRRLWEKRPWHTKNIAVDSTFWVGFAHLGARVTSTGRPGFIYRQHGDSVSHKLTPMQRRQATRQWLKACRKWTLT